MALSHITIILNTITLVVISLLLMVCVLFIVVDFENIFFLYYSVYYVVFVNTTNDNDHKEVVWIPNLGMFCMVFIFPNFLICL